MKLLLVGGGNMGTALLAGWQQGVSREHIPAIAFSVIEPYISEKLKSICPPDALYESASAIDGAFDVIVLAIKPQGFDAILPQLKPLLKADTLILSIAAGKTMQSIAHIFGDEKAIIRVMPNTPALIGEGMSVLVANENVTDTQKDLANKLLQAVGKTLWIQDEDDMHAVTSVSGSGPAYVFALIEAMQKAGMALGLADDIALQLARQTVAGSAKLAAEQDSVQPLELRRQVTSAGGTTEAALNVLLNEDALDQLLGLAISAAAKRSQELA